MTEHRTTQNGASNGHEKARWRELGAKLDALMREQMWKDLRNLDPRKTAIWTAGTLLGIVSWLFVIWLGVRWLG